MYTKRAAIARSLAFTKRQEEIIIGSLLGDGHLARTTRGYAFRVNHGLIQREYVDWKYRELELFTNSQPGVYGTSYYFRTISHPYFDDLRSVFYRESRKIVPDEFELWLTPLALAVWFMDDGTREGKQVRLNTQCFTRDEHDKLARILEATLGIATTINRDKDRYRLRIQEESMPRFRQLVRPHIIPSMHYKLPP